MTLLNKTACRRFMLDYANSSRHHKFTSVSKATMDAAESGLRCLLRRLTTEQSTSRDIIQHGIQKTGRKSR